MVATEETFEVDVNVNADAFLQFLYTETYNRCCTDNRLIANIEVQKVQMLQGTHVRHARIEPVINSVLISVANMIGLDLAVKYHEETKKNLSGREVMISVYDIEGSFRDYVRKCQGFLRIVPNGPSACKVVATFAVEMQCPMFNSQMQSAVISCAKERLQGVADAVNRNPHLVLE